MHWKFARYENINNSLEQILVVPATTRTGKGYSRALLLKINGEIQTRIFTMYSRGKSNFFTGRIAVRDIYGRFTHGYLAQDGKLTSLLIPSKNSSKCEDYYEGEDWNCGELDEVIIMDPKLESDVGQIYDGSSGGGDGDSSWNYDSSEDTGGGSGAGSTTNVTNEEADAFEEKIDDTDLDDCLKKILNDLLGFDKGVGEIIAKFAGSDPGFNWKLQNGTLSISNAQTSQIYNSMTGTVTSTFDPQKFSNASNLSTARTILHESVHAYIVASFGSNYLGASQSFSDFFHEFNQNKYPSRNDADHAEFARNYIDNIAIALEEFGEKKRLNLSSQFYNDLSWGGLTDWLKRDSNGNILMDSQGNAVFEETPWFKSIFPNSSDRMRIKNIILIEQTGKDIYGNTKPKKGNSSGC